MSFLSTARALVHARTPRARFALALGGIALVGIAVRVAFALTAEVPVAADPRSYHFLGVNLADGLGYVRPPQLGRTGPSPVPTAEFPPLFPGLLAVASWLGMRTKEAQALFTAFFGTSTVVLLGIAGRRFADARVGLVAAAIAAVHPLIFQPDSILMSESLYLVLVSAVLLAALTAVEDPGGWWQWALLGLLIGLAALTRTEALLFPIVLVIPLVVRRGHGRTAVRAGLVTVVAAALVVVPWTVRNAIEFDRFVPVSTNTGTVTLGANCALTYEGRALGSWSYACIAGFAGTQGREARVRANGRNEAEVYDSWRSAGLDYASEHLGRLPVVVTARVLRTWGLWDPTALADFDVREGRDRTLQTIGYWLALALLPFAVAGAISLRHRRGWRIAWILVAPAVVATVVAAIGFGSTRIRVVAEPGLAILAAVGVERALAVVASRRAARTVPVASSP